MYTIIYKGRIFVIGKKDLDKLRGNGKVTYQQVIFVIN